MDGFRPVGGVDKPHVVQEAVLLLQGEQVRLGTGRFGRHRAGQDNVQVANGRLRRFTPSGLFSFEIKVEIKGQSFANLATYEDQSASGLKPRLRADNNSVMPYPSFPHEGDAPNGIGVIILDSDGKRQPVLTERSEGQGQLFARLGDGH